MLVTLKPRSVVRVSTFPVFVTPDDIRAEPFKFSREVRLRKATDHISASVRTEKPVSDPLLMQFGGHQAHRRWTSWWQEWMVQFDEKRYLREECETLDDIFFELQGLLGRFFMEPDFQQVH